MGLLQMFHKTVQDIMHFSQAQENKLNINNDKNNKNFIAVERHN